MVPAHFDHIAWVTTHCAQALARRLSLTGEPSPLTLAQALCWEGTIGQG